MLVREHVARVRDGLARLAVCESPVAATQAEAAPGRNPTETDGCMTGGEFGVREPPAALPREHARRVDGSLEALRCPSGREMLRARSRLAVTLKDGVQQSAAAFH